MTESLYTTQTPSSTNNSDGAPGITRGMYVTFAADGVVSGIRFFATTTVSGVYSGALWQTVTSDPNTGGGALLASKVMGTVPTPGVWNSILFDTPVNVTAGTPYRVGAFSGDGRYVATAHLFDGPIVNGNITAPANGSPLLGGTANQNQFIINATLAYPTGQFNATGYFVDVLFQAGPHHGTADFGLDLAVASAGDRPSSGAGHLDLQFDLTATGLTPTLVVPVDPIGTPVAQELLTCFTEQLQQLASPPKYIQLRVGQETGPLIGANVDECCAGLAWIRIANIYPSWDSFPAADNTWLPCGPLAYAVVLEMGVAFCMPWSDSSDTFDNQDPPNAADWATAFATQMQHQTLMRRSAACCWRPTQRRAVGEWTPLPVEAGCTGGKLLVTVSVPAPCGDC
jgi:hypothetical protein